MSRRDMTSWRCRHARRSCLLAAGTLLTQLMARAMNRPITNVLFSSFGSSGGGQEEEVSGSLKPIDADDAAVMMAYAEKVIIVPGYGMAVAQAQQGVDRVLGRAAGLSATGRGLLEVVAVVPGGVSLRLLSRVVEDWQDQIKKRLNWWSYLINHLYEVLFFLGKKPKISPAFIWAEPTRYTPLRRATSR